MLAGSPQGVGERDVRNHDAEVLAGDGGGKRQGVVGAGVVGSHQQRPFRRDLLGSNRCNRHRKIGQHQVGAAMQPGAGGFIVEAGCDPGKVAGGEVKYRPQDPAHPAGASQPQGGKDLIRDPLSKRSNLIHKVKVLSLPVEPGLVFLIIIPGGLLAAQITFS